MSELKKYNRRRLIDLARRMIDDLDESSWRNWGLPGIRAQLIDTRRRKLEMDFIYEGDAQSLHVLNAVSPAFTCTFSFARLLADQVQALWAGRPTIGQVD